MVAPLGQDFNNAKPHFQGLSALATAFRPYRTGRKTTFIENLLNVFFTIKHLHN